MAPFFISSFEFYTRFLSETKKHIQEYAKIRSKDMRTALGLVSAVSALPALTVAPIRFSGPWK